MNCLRTRNSPISPAWPYSYDYERNHSLKNTANDSCGCPSDLFFANSAYTLSLGQLLSGDLHRYQPDNPISPCPTSCSCERPICCKPCPMPTRSFPINPLINAKVNEAMKTIRKTAQKPCHYSIPSVPHCYNPIINQNHMTKAAGVLEQAANAMSMATNRQSQYC